MKKIITIVGARPQFIKAAAVSRVLQQKPNLREIIIHTGQHYDNNMSDIFLDELAIPAIDYQLTIGSHPHGKQTGMMLMAIEDILIKEKPDLVLIYGDTNSTLAGALAAAKIHIPIAHVEAGLRSYNKKMPEEINRIVADQLSDMLFAPTTNAVLNLQKEGYDKNKIINVGDVMFDAALFYAQKAIDKSDILKKLAVQSKEYILVTLHRAENTDNANRLTNIFNNLNKLTKSYPVVMPLHPRTRKAILNYDSKLLSSSEIKIINPVGFLDMILLEKNASLIMTDSGGVQKEAFFYQIPCVTLRNETEWIETVQLGWNTLVKPDTDPILEKALSALHTQGQLNQYPYGQGNASCLIANYLN